MAIEAVVTDGTTDYDGRLLVPERFLGGAESASPSPWSKFADARGPFLTGPAGGARTLLAALHVLRC